MKHKLLNILILIITLSLVLFFTLKDDFIGVINELKKVNILIVLFAIIIFLFAHFIKSISLNIFLGKKFKKSLKYTYELTLIGQLISGITPFNSGGQPYEVYLLKKDGVRITDSTSAMIKDFISYQVALIIVAITMIILSRINDTFPNNSNINTLIILGFIINAVILLLLLVVSFGKSLFIKIIKKLFKIKFINKIVSDSKKVEESLNNFYSSGIELKKDKWMFVKSILLNIIYLILLYTIPLFIFRAFDVFDISVLSSISATTFVMLIGNSVPIPGGSGGIEYSFMQFFGVFASGPVLSGAMLIWRFVTYVISLLIGFIVLIIKKGSVKR